MENPSLVVLTDGNDLDGQLHDTFSDCADLLRQKPVQAESRENLRELLNVASGGVVFTTIQKFMPPGARDGSQSGSSGGGAPSGSATSIRPAQQRRHRRRSASQPIRFH